MRMSSASVLTLALGLCVTLATVHTSPAAPGKMVKMPAASAAMITHGKAVAESNGCSSCHSANYAGKKSFSPSIRANGVTKQYTLVKWERVMNTGVTEDGGHVQKPMPVYRMAAKDSAPLYAFLKAQK